MNNTFESNEYLVSQVKRGNKSAYNYLVELYHHKIFSYALSLTNDYTVTQDIIQNVFLRTWEYRENLNTIYPIKSFLYKATYNEFVNLYHKNQSMSMVEGKFVEAINMMTSEDNHELLEKRKAIVRKEIEKLPVKCKEAFLLSKKEGLTNKEIADHLNVSIKAVEGHITKAYFLLRKSCNENLHTVLFLLFGRNVMMNKQN